MPETGPEAQESFVLRGDIAYSKDPETLVTYEDAYVVCVDGVSRGVFKTLPDDYRDLPVEDYSGRLILPGFSDLHVHAPQYQYRGNGMDLTLLDWLDQYAFPEEARVCLMQKQTHLTLSMKPGVSGWTPSGRTGQSNIFRKILFRETPPPGRQ